MSSSSPQGMQESANVSSREAFRHIFLTRFSVRFTHDQPAPDEAWLRYRLGFFAQATVASMRSQAVAYDDWLVFCDTQAPDWLKAELAELGENTFTVIWLSEPWGHAVLRHAVARIADRPYLITTRLDSDDAVGTQFSALVQYEFDYQTAMYVNVLRGVQIDRSLQAFRYDYPENPFISLIERLEGHPRTVFQSFRHSDCRALAPVRNVVSAPAWLQVVHGANLMNEVRGPRVDSRFVAENFAMNLDFESTPSRLTYAGQWIVSWMRLVALWSKRPWLARQYIAARRLIRRGTTTL